MPVKKTNKKVIKKEVTKKINSKPAVKTVKKTVVTPKNVQSKISMPQFKAMPIKKIDSKKLIKPLIFLLILAAVYLLKDEVIVASVNGKPVSRWALVRNLEKQSASTVLENMTLQMLVEQELKKAGVEVTDEEMDAEISKIEEQLAAQGQNLDDLLAAQGLTRATVKEQLALSKGMEKLLSDNITVTDEEIAAYFEQNKEMIGADVAFEDIKADIEAQLRQEKLATEQQKWFAEIKKNAKINYFKFAPSTNL
jgi:foldase protein PrsA